MIMTIVLAISVQTSFSDFEKELKTFYTKTSQELSRIEKMQDSLSKSDLDRLNKTYLDESTTELDHLTFCDLHMRIGLESYLHFLKKQSEPIKIDAVGQPYRLK